MHHLGGTSSRSRHERNPQRVSSPNDHSEGEIMELVAIIEIIADANSVSHASKPGTFLPLGSLVTLMNQEMNDHFAYPSFALADQAQ
jgi:hypothetical protein